MASFLEFLITQVDALSLEHLLPGPLPTVGPNSLDAKNLEGQQSLANLCKTSKVCKKRAQPLLYQDVVINDLEPLVHLFTTLLNNPDVRPMIRSFSCPFDICGEGNADNKFTEAIVKITRDPGKKEENILKCAGLELQPLSDDMVLLRAKDKYEVIRMPEGHNRAFTTFRATEDYFVQGLVVGILLMAPNVENILLSAPLLASGKKYHGGIMQALNRDWVPAGRDKTLQRVTTLRFRGSVSEIFKRNGFAELGGIDSTIIPVRPLGQTQSLELLGDSGDWKDMINACYFEGPSFSACLRHLTELKLYHSRTSDIMLYFLLGQCPQLKSLTYTTRAREWKLISPTQPRGSINMALLRVAYQLEVLHYEALTRALPHGSIETDDETALPEHITCLTSFPKLKHLTIDVRSFWGATYEESVAWEPLSQDYGPEFAAWLPPHIETLTITEQYPEARIRAFHTHPVGCMFRHDLPMVHRLEFLILDLGFGKLPRLRKLVWRATHVCALPHGAWAETGSYLETCRRVFLAIKARRLTSKFPSLGVEFAFELAPVMRCEDAGETHGLCAAYDAL